ncbi:unnamed protein product [Effrenium voratum]|nr:unnamed protein product [Effrenium voratum]
MKPRNRRHVLLPLVLVSGLAFLGPPPVGKPSGRVASQAPEALAVASAPVWFASPACAADSLESAGAAYGHYLSLIVAAGCLVAHRLKIKPGMSKEEEEELRTVDAVYVASSVLFVFTGFWRISYDKGWDFYQHEPIFWVKLLLAGVYFSTSTFVTASLLKRISKPELQSAPIGEKLVTRMTQVINAQLLALGSIPLAATLMARGVGYLEWLPWQPGAAVTLLATAGLSARYIKEALDFDETAE